ncbi:YopT-type cysteine protease domain-containing protein [Endozoicomonas gorgoniicola]|uniref:YopT-type cysteine protease domain-containing protein n=1 Tax=Endozoicomonas gorgoniicola TaxID=1234144 RepID=A0ABT3MQ72_9GAMM|nr:YopT-type cysteine protease domain-containing protein [Endozoicomonas gorgoniicola]MCW7551525.1 YopT-type cysteine protease domain-containing protein [Endozoicomonas gorgoniicola]
MPAGRASPLNRNYLIRKYNGRRAWEFSQADFSSLGGQPAGVCVALCANWIRYHSQNDSLANYIGSKKKEYLNTLLAKEMARLNNFMNHQGRRYDNSRLELFFKMHGIFPLYSSREHTILSYPEEEILEKIAYRKKREILHEEYQPDIETQITSALIGLGNCYAIITFYAGYNGHTICVWLGWYRDQGGDACMFDPNLGEAWFSNRQDFICFFPEYFRKCYKPDGLIDKWQVIPLAPALPLTQS